MRSPKQKAIKVLFVVWCVSCAVVVVVVLSFAAYVGWTLGRTIMVCLS